jgi:KDO2-lipid IV(A) lauroyltransferase
MKLNRIYRPFFAWLMRTFSRLAQAVPRRLALAIGDQLGRAVYHLCSRDRRLALEHLTLAFGRTRSRREIYAIARRCFRLIGRSAVEVLRLPAMTEEELVSVVDCDSVADIEQVLARGKGMILLTAHFGAWELLGAYGAIRLGRPFYAVGRRLYYSPFDDVITSIRRGAGVETVYQEEGARRLLKVLRRNRPLALVGDQDIPRLDGVFVDFFGRPARTPTGPVALARVSGAGIVPSFITWKGRRHHVHVLPEVELVRTRDRHADFLENTRRCTKATEDIIRRYPEHWMWFHRRWRTQPAPEAAATEPERTG